MEECFTFTGASSHHCLKMLKDSASNFQGVGQATQFLNTHPHVLREGDINFYYSTFRISIYPLDTLISYAWLSYSFGISYHRKMTHPVRYIPTSKINSLTINLLQQATSRLSFSQKQKRYKEEGLFSYFFVPFFKEIIIARRKKLKLSEAGPEEDLTANGECRHSWLDARTLRE